MLSHVILHQVLLGARGRLPGGAGGNGLIWGAAVWRGAVARGGVVRCAVTEAAEGARGLDADAHCWRRQVRQRDFFDLDDLQRVRVRPGGDGPLARLVAGLCEQRVAAVSPPLEDPVDLPADG